MSEEPADFVTVLSSDMIATIVEAYFNKAMYKKQVKVVDLQPQGTGYAFSLAFVQVNNIMSKSIREDLQLPVDTDFIKQFEYGSDGKRLVLGKRDSKGRFAKHETNN